MMMGGLAHANLNAIPEVEMQHYARRRCDVIVILLAKFTTSPPTAL
jgi:hypothetical protein